MVKGLQGAIIAAGRGERLRNSTRDDIPKPLVKLGGEAMLLRQGRPQRRRPGETMNTDKATVAAELESLQTVTLEWKPESGFFAQQASAPARGAARSCSII